MVLPRFLSWGADGRGISGRVSVEAAPQGAARWAWSPRADILGRFSNLDPPVADLSGVDVEEIRSGIVADPAAREL